jgi:hypothetical protein
MAENSGKTARGRPFRPGQSGNPGGRPRKTPEQREIEELARSKSRAAILRLAAIIRDGKDADAIRACEAILARAFGRPEQKQESEVKGGLSFELIVAKPEKALEAGDERRSLPREVDGDGQSLPGFRELPEGELPE